MPDADAAYAPSRKKIGRQIVLPWSKAFEIAWEGVRIRLWRSLITMAGIVLAIAFLTSVWVSGAFTGALRSVQAGHELYPMVQGVLEARALAGGGVALQITIVEGEVRPVQGAITVGGSIRNSLDGFSGFGAEVVPLDANAILDVVGVEDGRQPDAVITVGLPDTFAQEGVPEALREYVKNGGFLLFYGAGDGSVPKELDPVLPAEPGTSTFSVGAGEIEDTGMLSAAWFNMPQTALVATTGKPRAEALAQAGGRTVAWGMTRGKGRIAWYPVTSESMADANHLSWLTRAKSVGGESPTDQRSSLLVRLVAYGCKEQLAGDEVDVRGLWLVGLSLMVCVVGITNAMLMSVTERFREIGTMKCLGALDSFIVKLFLIESLMQGFAGAIAGAVIGFVLAFVRALFAFHVVDPETGESFLLATRFFPALELVGWLGVALGTGVILTVVAAVYPAIRAARMEPVEAMRSEA